MLFKSEIQKHEDILNFPTSDEIFQKIKQDDHSRVKERFRPLREEFNRRSFTKETVNLKSKRVRKGFNILPSPGKAMVYTWPFVVKLKGLICFIKSIN